MLEETAVIRAVHPSYYNLLIAFACSIVLVCDSSATVHLRYSFFCNTKQKIALIIHNCLSLSA